MEKETKKLVNAIALIMIGLILGLGLAGMKGRQRKLDILGEAYERNLSDWDFQFKEGGIFGVDFELEYFDDPYQIKLYVDWNFKIIYVEIFKFQKVELD